MSGGLARPLAVVAALMALVVLLLPALLPLAWWRSEVAANVRLEQRAEHLRRELAGREALEAEVARATTPDGRGWMLEGPTPAVAASSLQGHLVERVRSTGGSVESVQVLPPRPLDAHVDIGLRIVLTTTHQGLRDLLLQVETGPPGLLVTALDITPRRDGPVGDSPDALRVTLTVSGLMRTQAAG